MPPATISETQSSLDGLTVPWSDVVRFVRQVSHDLRNQLNAAELQAAYLGEVADDAEIKSEIKRLREMISEFGGMLQKLTASLGQIKLNPIPYQAADFMEDMRRRVATDFPKESPTVNWDIQLPEVNIEIDPQLLQQALSELFANAFRHQPTGGVLKVKARSEGDAIVLRLHEPKENFELSLENWGREPLRNIGQGHYGLGLNRVRIIIEAHGGKFGAQYDRNTSTLVTTITIPLSGQRS
jgi:signal transduction histidine kinase